MVPLPFMSTKIMLIKKIFKGRTIICLLRSNKTFLLFIVILALFLRVYKLGVIPPSISWDEAANGYNAWTIANFGKDEYGKVFPFFFKSFGDDKHPIHIYTTAIFVKLLGLSEFSTRLPSATFGVFNVILLYYLAKVLFANKEISLMAALLLAISPYNIHFSRFNHELNFTIFFFMFGVLLFIIGVSGRKKFLPISYISFGISLLAYHSAKVVVPPVLLALHMVYLRQLLMIKKYLLTGMAILSIFLGILIVNPELLGTARVRQTSFSQEQLKNTYLYKLTGSGMLGRINIVASQYIVHFSPKFLFISGDNNPRLSVKTAGEFYRIEFIFLIFGLVYLIRNRNKLTAVLILWALLAPIPSSAVNEAPHAARAMFITGSWHLISAAGFYFFITVFKNTFSRKIVLGVCLLLLGWQMSHFLNYYYNEYSKRSAIEWQYGMRQIVEFTSEHKEYSVVNMTDVRSQPYIFFLYYLQVPPDTYVKTVKYNLLQSKSYNLISSFDRYFFGGWNEIESMPEIGTLYIVEPSKYDGLRYKQAFNFTKFIKHPDGTDAFYLVSAY